MRERERERKREKLWLLFICLFVFMLHKQGIQLSDVCKQVNIICNGCFVVCVFLSHQFVAVQVQAIVGNVIS